MVKITEVGYNEWFPLPYYVRIMTTDIILEDIWKWNCDNLRGWALRPDKTGIDQLIYTHACFHFRTEKTRDWFILKWS